MSTIVTPLNAEELRTIRDNTAVLTDRPPGVDLAGKVNTLAAQAKADVESLETDVEDLQTLTGIADDPEGAILVAEGTIAFAAVRTLNATPVEVIPAPGAGLFVEVLDCQWFLDFGTAAYDAPAAGDTLGLKYTNGSGVQLLDVLAGNGIGAASADYHAMARGLTEVNLTAADNAAVVAHIDAGEWYSAAGDSPLKYRIRYRIRTLAISG